VTIPFGRQLARSLCPYGSTRRVLRGPARGFRIVIEPGLGLTYLISTPGAAPPVFARAVREGMTVVDVGANKGQMTLLFAALVGPAGRVIAIEPAPREFESLARNVRLNGLAHVDLLQAAAAESAAWLTFAYAPDRPTQGKLVGVETSYRVAGARTLDVQAMPLDALLDRGIAPDVVKLDVEGGAAAALRGARRMLDELAPAVYVELHGPEEQAGVRDELLARGYVAHRIDGLPVPDPTAGWFTPLWCHRPGPEAGDRNLPWLN